MYALNKLVWIVFNPAALACVLLALMFFETLRRGPRCTRLVLAGVLFVGFWIWSTPMMSRIVGLPLEESFLVDGRYSEAESFPTCDAIVIMGGGIGGNTNVYQRAILHAGADRAYFAALLWKAQKAPVVIPSGKGSYSGDRIMLLDLGVPESAIVIEDEAENTEQNARCVSRLVTRFRSSKIQDSAKGTESGIRTPETRPVRILLVTSAWHMKRTILMFKKYAPEIEVVPAPCDFECVLGERWHASDFLPDPAVFAKNSVYLHEWIGYWGYRWFR